MCTELIKETIKLPGLFLAAAILMGWFGQVRALDENSHLLKRYGHFKFDIKIFCAFTLLFCVKIESMANKFVFLSTLS